MSRPPLDYPLRPRPLHRPEKPRHVELRFSIPQIYLLGTCAFAFASLLIQSFVGDTYVIRTGSMEPTVVGRPDRGDRVLLSPLPYSVRDPRRFEVVLFTYPNNRSMRYLKRLVGMPDEQLIIAGGDLYLADAEFGGELSEGYRDGRVRILRKPARTQEDLLQTLPVLFKRELQPLDTAKVNRHFRVSLNGGSIEDEEGSVLLKSPGELVLEGRRQPRDILYDALDTEAEGAPQTTGLGGEKAVGDLSLRVEICGQSPQGSLSLTIHDPVGRGDASATLTLAPTGHCEITWKSQVLATGTIHIPKEGWHSVRLDNIDDRIQLFLDDRLLLSGDYRHPPQDPDDRIVEAPGGISLALKRGSVSLRSVELRRDIHWLSEGSWRFIIPPDHFVFLGDNTASSSDSRAWRQVFLRIKATGQILRGDRQGVVAGGRSIVGRNPWEMPDGRWVFVDLLGQRHVFEEPREYEILGDRATPYVPRSAIQAVGIAVVGPRPRAHVLH